MALKRLSMLGAGVCLISCAGATPNPNAPGLSVPHEIAAGNNPHALPRTPAPSAPGAKAGEAGESGAPAVEETPASAVPGPPSGGYAPDPEPLRLKKQYDFRVAYRDGDVSLESAIPVTLAAPVVTVRKMGRFALELWVGSELVERVRFDFPLLAAQGVERKDTSRPMRDPPRFQVDSVVTVRVPASIRATRAVIVDRATGQKTPVPWPPEAPITPPPREMPEQEPAPQSM